MVRKKEKPGRRNILSRTLLPQKEKTSWRINNIYYTHCPPIGKGGPSYILYVPQCFYPPPIFRHQSLKLVIDATITTEITVPVAGARVPKPTTVCCPMAGSVTLRRNTDSPCWDWKAGRSTARETAELLAFPGRFEWSACQRALLRGKTISVEECELSFGNFVWVDC